MSFKEFAPAVQRLVRAEYPSVPKGSIIGTLPRIGDMHLEWVGPHVTVRLTQADDEHVLLHVIAEGVSIQPVPFPMTANGARAIAISLAATFDGPSD